jgi:hypothetical protein
MTFSPARLAPLAALLMALAACAPMPEPGTRLSTQADPACAFAAGSCESLHRLRPPVW